MNPNTDPTSPTSPTSPKAETHDLEGGYTAVPFETTTLNGMFLPTLLGSSQSDRWAVIGPDNRALQNEDERTQSYASLQDCRKDVKTLRKLKGELINPYRLPTGKQVRADQIPTGIMFIPGEEENGIPYSQNLEWLAQYTHGENQGPLDPEKVYLILGDETAPEEIWESVLTDPENRDKIHSPFQKIWRDPGLQEWDVTILATITKTIRVKATCQKDAEHDAQCEFRMKAEPRTEFQSNPISAKRVETKE